MTIKQVMAAFVRGATKGRAASVYIEDNAIFSYGPHFPLAIRTKDGFVLNTDKYSVTTSKQQSYLRYALLGERVAESTTDEMRRMIR